MKTIPILLLICCAFGKIISDDLLGIVESYTEPRNSMKMTAIDKQWKKVKITGEMDVFPNESPIKVFCDMETLEISWSDPENTVFSWTQKFDRNCGMWRRVRQIENALLLEPKPMCNALFDVISNWSCVAWEAEPFYQAVILAMSKYVDVDRDGESQQPPLLRAAQHDVAKAVLNLIERGVSTETKDYAGRTALHFAAWFGHESSCEVLLKNNANPNPQSSKGHTPLMFAAEMGNVRTVKVLLKFGAKVDLRNEDGSTALMFAAKSICSFAGYCCDEEESEIVDLLLQFGANTKITDKSGKSPLQLAHWKSRGMAILISAEETAHKEKFLTHV